MIMIRIDGFAYIYTSLDSLLDAIAENAYDSWETGGEDGIYEAERECGNPRKKLIEFRREEAK